MKRMRSLPWIATLALCACASTSERDAPRARDARGGEAAAAKGEKPEEGGKDAAKEAEKKADELRAKKRELEYAQIGLEIARLDVQADEITTRRAVEEAERAVAVARADLQNFQTVVRELETSERALQLDRARQDVHESEQELAELEAMYANEQFAETTKELVLTRGRTRLAMSKRSYEHAQRRSEQMRQFDQPRRERELKEASDKAEKSLADARARDQRSGVQRKLDSLKAAYALEEAERAVAKLEGELAAAQKPVAQR